jgi:hypothetical protein
MMCDISVVIVAWNVAGALREALHSLSAGAEGLAYEVIVIDNASADGSAAMVRAEFPSALLIANTENLGFARANNQGLRISRGRYVLLLNSDTATPAGALGRLAGFLDSHPEAGAVGPRLLRPGGTPQPYAFGSDPTIGYLLRRGANRLLFRRPLHDWATTTIQEVDWVSGACLLVRREAIEQVGLLDEQIFMYFEDNDWCLRMRAAGWKIYYNPGVAIVHLGGQSLARNPGAHAAYYRSLEYFYGKHYGRVARTLLGAFLAPYRLFAARRA